MAPNHDDTTRLIVRDEINEYFNHFLEKVLPRIIAEQLNASPQIRFVTRMKWSLIGAAVTASILIPTVGWRVLNIIS